MEDNAAVVRAFLAAWSRLDAFELADYFTDDGVYHNMPAQPVRGRDNVRALIAGFTRGWSGAAFEVINLAASGEVVVVERIDRMTVGGRAVELPCCGVFEMRGGMIAVWRDYFDMKTYLDAIQPGG